MQSKLGKEQRSYFGLDRDSLPVVLMFSFLLALGIAGRIGSYWYGMWNVTPVAAIGLFAGFYFRHRAVAFFLPLAVMVLTNVVIGSYESEGMRIAVYVALLIPVLLASPLRKKLTALRVGVCSVSSSVLFFIVTNFCHWVFMRPHTATDLARAYIDAIPFFRPTLAGDLFFTAVIFGCYALATWRGFLPGRYVRVPVKK